MNIPEALRYTIDHEWLRKEGKLVVIGVTDYAQSELGDIVYVEIETLDEKLEAGEVFGTIEAVKTVSDLIMPVGGKIVEVNTGLEENPETVNTDPYNKGWMITVEISDQSEADSLLDAVDYKSKIGIDWMA